MVKRKKKKKDIIFVTFRKEGSSKRTARALRDVNTGKRVTSMTVAKAGLRRALKKGRSPGKGKIFNIRLARGTTVFRRAR